MHHTLKFGSCIRYVVKTHIAVRFLVQQRSELFPPKNVVVIENKKKNERSRSYEHGLIIPVSNSVYSETRESDHFQSTKFWKICTYTEIPHSDDDGQALSSILNALNETIRPGINFLETLNNQRVDKCSPICISRYARPALL